MKCANSAVLGEHYLECIDHYQLRNNIISQNFCERVLRGVLKHKIPVIQILGLRSNDV
jgi:hypothetical protein